MASHQYSHSSLGDYQIAAQASQVPPKIDAPTGLEPEPELSRGCDIILQHAQELKDEIVRERQRNKDCIQDLEQRLAECRAEISQLKATFMIGDEQVVKKLDNIYQSLWDWITNIPEFIGFADGWQTVREFLDKESYLQGHHPWIESDEVMRAHQTDLWFYCVLLILHKWVFQPVLAGADADTQALLTQLLGSLAALEPRPDTATVGSWRSNFYRSYIRLDCYTGHCEAVYSRILPAVKKLFRIAGVSEQDYSPFLFLLLCETVIRPAIRLAMTMRCSTEDYEWVWFFPGRYGNGKIDLDESAVELWDMSHQKVMVENIRDINKGKTTCDYIMPMYPSLWRASIDGKRRSCIWKARIKVKLQEIAPPANNVKLLPLSSGQLVRAKSNAGNIAKKPKTGKYPTKSKTG